MSIYHFWAFILARWNNKQHVSLIAFLNDCLAWLSTEFLQCLDYCVQIFALQAFENYCASQQVSEKLLGLWRFFDYFRDKIWFFIKNSETLCTNCLPAVFLFIFLLHLLEPFEKLLIFAIAIGARFADIFGSFVWIKNDVRNLMDIQQLIQAKTSVGFYYAILVSMGSITALTFWAKYCLISSFRSSIELKILIYNRKRKHKCLI